MASSSTLTASSSTSNCDSYEYHVFLSFRGKDTRNNFTDHLYASLIAHGIHTFRDEEELEKGGHIASNLFRAIEESKIFIIIFSETYAESKWCLNELVRIIDCMTKKKSTVLPIFYHVKPTNVRNQKGSFEDAFLDHAKDADEEKEKTIETWKNALKTAASLKGYHLDNQSEAEFIQRIREVIITRLNRKPLHVGENIVGMGFHLEQLRSLIKIESDEVHMVGIYGTGGIGKTTISIAIYNDISSQFDGSSFLRNVGGKCEDGLLEVQKTLLQNILKGKRPKFSDISEGINVIKERLRSKRVLIVLDDVDKYIQLESLAGKHGWYGAKSLIIITTKDKHLLELHEVNAVYEVQKLNHEKSTALFNWWAFKQNTPIPKFETLSDNIVKYADGLPIALRVLGGFLFKKSINEWESELYKLEKIPDRTVQSVLKVSYDKLDLTQQKVFLDIACFFRGEDKDCVLRILGRYSEVEIKVLHDRCLITISENKLDMHDLLQQMGREIVRQECIDEPGKRSRLWDFNDVDSVLTRNTGTEAIEGLCVEMSITNKIQFSTYSFTKLNRLRLLKVYSQWWGRKFLAELPPDIEFHAFNLRYFHFDYYPLESLPSNFHAKNLVELNLRNSNIKQLWKENKILNNLKVINLSYSEDLVEVPDLSSVPNLEILILRGCRSLESLPSSIGHLKALKRLDLKSCAKLVSLPESISNMENLEWLELSFTDIEELPYSIGRLKALKHLDLGPCESLRSLPESIWNLSSLETLWIYACPKLERLEVTLGTCGPKCFILKGGIWWSSNRFSSSKTLNLQHNKMEGEVLNHHVFPLSSLAEESGILSDGLSSLKISSVGNFSLMEAGIRSDFWNLSSLEELFLRNCNVTEGEILNHVCHLSSLEMLSLEGSHFSSIPAGISRLSHLRVLILSHCNKLQEIPELPSSLRFLDVHCSEGILSSPSLLSIPSLLNYFNLELIEEIDAELEFEFNHSEFVGKGMSIVIPRSSGIVQGIRNQSMGSHRVTIELPQNWYENDDLWGFAVCCFYVHKMDGNVSVRDDELDEADSEDELDEMEGNVPVLKDPYHLLTMFCSFGIRGTYYMDQLSVSFDCCDEHNDDSVSDQVWVIYYPKDAIKEDYRSNQRKHLMASFHCRRRALKVKECGIHPIYMSNTHVRSSFGTDQFSSPSLEIFLEFPEATLENLRELHLDGTAIEELPPSIQQLRGLQCLSLAYCNNLVSLPLTICHLKSLVFLSCIGSSQLNSFPEILENMENLRELYLDGTAIKELPTSIEHLRRLQVLCLSNCNNLVNLPESICNLRLLKYLNVNLCSKLEKFPENLRNLQCLKGLGAAGFDSNQVLGAIQSDVCHMSSWETLNVCIIQFSKLRVLDLSHCQKLLKIPDLPPNLRILDAHHCPCLETLSTPSSLLGFSLFKCFKSAIEEFERESNRMSGIMVVIPGNNGIPEWISQQKKGSEITLELPMDWHQNNDFLGFALFSVYVPLHIESKENPCSLKCELTFHPHQFEFMDNLPSKLWPVGELSFTGWYSCCHNGGESNRVWVAYYPKVAIRNEYWSTEWRHLKASFHGHFGTEPAKVEECGFHLIYMPKTVNRTIPQEDTNVKGVKRNHAAMTQYPDV